MSTFGDILLVEDDIVVADVLRRILVRAAYTVRIATDGIHALEALGQDRPAVLILDLVLPRMNGFTVLEHMRQQQMTLPVIVITANPLYLDSVRTVGILHVLLKPFLIEELLAALRAIIDLPAPA
jgi:DNA-binding response OmpR family regulator